jgi:aminopeptidase
VRESGEGENGAVSVERYVEALAQLAVRFGANVQPGQLVTLEAQPGKEALTRAIVRAAYRRGAKFVDLAYFDYHVKHARLSYADPETLSFVPPWYAYRMRTLGAEHSALIAVSGPIAPRLMEGLDPALLGVDMLPRIPETSQMIEERLLNWCVIPGPVGGWASLVYPSLGADDALARLWEDIARVCRLDEPDPEAAWRTRFEQINNVAARLTALELDAVRFEGPGTDLFVGLLPGSVWLGADMTTVDGIRFAANIPTEEVFTTPDPLRSEGFVTSTKPLFVSGGMVEGLRMRFEGGRAVSIEADSGAEILQRLTARDEGGARLGEVALVDRDSRVGSLDTVFYDTLLDENAASHVALGQAYAIAVEDDESLARINHSEIHEDFMIGSSAVAVTGIRRDGGSVALLRDGAWQI